MINFTAWPEMIAWPYLMLNGWLSYRDIAIAHNPLLLVTLAIFYKIVGIGIIQLKIFTWILIAVNAYITYYVGRKFWSQKIGLVSSLLYLVLCIIFQGNGLWFDIALTPFALLLYYFLRQKNYLWLGIIFALGFLTKQTFIYFLIPILLSRINLKKFIIGGLSVAIIFILTLQSFGILDDYYAWAIKFGILYLPNAEGQVLWPTLKQFLFALAPFGIFILNFNFSLLIFALVGLMGVYPRFELFHFQPALPFLAIAISIFFYSSTKKLFKYLVLSLLLTFIIIGIKRNLGNVTRFFESDVQNVSSKIMELKYKNIYVANYWDNIYALTNTLPNKPLIPYIPWYLEYGNSKELIINNLKSKMPEAIVIGERDTIFPELYDFVDKLYTCNIVEKKVELCEKNNK